MVFFYLYCTFVCFFVIYIHQHVDSISFTHEQILLQYQEYLTFYEKPLTRLQDSLRIQQFLHTYEYIQQHNNNLNQTNNLNTNQTKNIYTKQKYQLQLNQYADSYINELFPFSQTNIWNISDWELYMKKQWLTFENISEQTIEKILPKTSKTNPKTNPALDHNKDYESTLNWASSDNPLGQTLFSQVHNQGSCGACWAFVASSAVEATIRLTLSTYLPITTGLSAQELIDCDLRFNQGCNGGNPLFALNYVIENGLYPENKYIYSERMNPTCREIHSSMKYFIQNVRKLPNNDETTMMKALQSGPVLVGK